MFKQELRQAAESYGLPLTEEQLSRFERYYELLIEWNQKMNLTAITEPREVAVKHMIDSLSAWDDSLFLRKPVWWMWGPERAFRGYR